MRKRVTLGSWKAGHNFGSWHVVKNKVPRCGFVPTGNAAYCETVIPLREIIAVHLDTLCRSCGKALSNDLTKGAA